MRQAEPPAKKVATPAEDDEDNDIDLFGSEEEEEEDKEAARLREERLRQYAEKKARKPSLVAKSSILLDVKPVRGSVGGWKPSVLGPEVLLGLPSGLEI
jgi:elongation factor 1-delta